VSEFVPDYEVSSWFGVGVPKNTPAEIIDQLNRVINAGLEDSRVRAAVAGARFFFGFRPRLLGIGKQWVAGIR
jgi:hypothetical protein